MNAGMGRKTKFKKEAREEGRQEGRREGRDLGIKALIITSFKLGAADDDVICQLMDLYQLTEDEARERISHYRKNI